jgi:hypothetical protein
VVQHKHPTIAPIGRIRAVAVESEVTHAVVMIAGALRTGSRWIGTAIPVVGNSRGNRITKSEDNFHRITRRHDDGVHEALGDGVEVEPQSCRGSGFGIAITAQNAVS